MTEFLVSFAVSALMSWVAVTMLINYCRRRHDRIQAPIAETLWTEGVEIRQGLHKDGADG